MLYKHQTSPCLLPPPLSANAITTGSCPTSEVPHNSPTVIRRGLSHSSSSHCQRQAPSLGTQAWGQKNKSTRAEKKAFRADRGFTADSQHELHPGQVTVLAPAVNAQGQGLLFCQLAQRLTHGEPQPDGGLLGRKTLPYSNVSAQNGNTGYKVVFLSTSQLAACSLSSFSVPPHATQIHPAAA